MILLIELKARGQELFSVKLGRNAEGFEHGLFINILGVHLDICKRRVA